MQRQIVLPALIALASASTALGQSLGDFLNGVNSAKNIIQSASASAAAAAATASSSSLLSSTATPSSSPSASQTSPTSSPSATPAPAKPGSSNKTLIIAVVCAVVGALLLALILLGVCCCLMRRRRKARKNRITAVAPADDEIQSWKSEKPQNPGRTYIPSQYGRVPSTEHLPMIPPTAAGGRHPDTHPAYRPENPFVPVPPSPRRSAPNSRSGLTDGNVPGDAPYVVPMAEPERQRLRSRSRSHSRSRPTTATDMASGGLPMRADADRPSTPFGLSGIGQPYEDMHVHVLQNEAPSQTLRQSLNNRDPLMSAQPHNNAAGYTTPPNVPGYPSRRSFQSTESPYTTASDGTSSTASEEYRAPYAPAISVPNTQPYSHRLNYDPPMQQQQPRQSQYTSQTRQSPPSNGHYSNSPTSMQPPPIPWGEPTEQRRQSPTRTSAQWAESGRRASRSPATSINGQPRRLRFSDIQASPTSPTTWDSRYRHNSQAYGGVGEAM